MKKLNKKQIEVIKEINASIPKHLLDRLMKKQAATPVIKQVVELAINDPDLPEEKKQKMRNILATGELDKQEEVADETIETEIEAFLNEEVRRAIKIGRLPNNIKRNGKSKK